MNDMYDGIPTAYPLGLGDFGDQVFALDPMMSQMPQGAGQVVDAALQNMMLHQLQQEDPVVRLQRSISDLTKQIAAYAIQAKSKDRSLARQARSAIGSLRIQLAREKSVLNQMTRQSRRGPQASHPYDHGVSGLGAAMPPESDAAPFIWLGIVGVALYFVTRKKK